MVEKKYAGFSEEHLRRIALKKVQFRMSIKIHIGIFIVVNTLLLILNLLFNPIPLWVIFPFFGWLIGLAEHIATYLVYARGIYPGAKRAMIFHSVAYIFVILYLFIINIMVTPDFYWVVFPTIFWGTGLVIHLVAYLIYRRPSIDSEGTLKSRTERAVEKELEKMKKNMNK
ncbi:MAG: 2TM domain-containing protein [Candidatus Odinarchaeota archaeon]